MARVEQRVLDELVNDCSTQQYDIVVSKWIVERIPAVFNGNEAEYRRIKSKIAQALDVNMCSVIFVGSGCTGFSLNPKKDFKTFDEDSDIDIAIISHHHFNLAWRWLRHQDYGLLKGDARNALYHHRAHYVFDGTIATDQILQFLPFGAEWSRVLSEIRQEPIFANKEVHFRLYQDHQALIDYHIGNIKKNLPKMLGVEINNVVLIPQE